MTAILIKRGRTDHTDLALCQRGLKDIRRVHGAFCVSGTHDVMHLINDQNDVLVLRRLIDNILHTALKLTAELGSRNHSGHIQKINGHIQELRRNFTICDLHRKTFSHSRLTDTRFTNQGRVILRTAVEDLNNSLEFLFTTDQTVDLSFFGQTRKIGAVLLEELILALSLFFLAFTLFLVFTEVEETEVGFILVFFFLSLLTENIERKDSTSRSFFTFFLFKRKLDVCVFDIHFHIRVIFREIIHRKTVVYEHLEKLLRIGRLSTAHQAVEAFGNIIDVAVVDAGRGKHLFDAADTGIIGALNTKALVNAFVILKTSGENDRHILFTYRTKTHLFFLTFLPGAFSFSWVSDR